MRKKTRFREDEIALGDSATDALLIKRNGWWQWRIYLTDEGKYLRKSLKTQSLDVAKERAMEAWRKLEREKIQGKKQFGLTVEQGIDKYLKQREKEVTEVEAGGITAGRYSTIYSQLKNFRRYMREHSEGAKLRDLKRGDCRNYFDWRRKTAEKEPATSTLLNEQAMINACVKYLFETHEISIPAFDFPKIRLMERNDTQRQTPSKAEYAWLVSEIGKRVEAKGEMLTDEERYKRQLFQRYFNIAANTGMRSGEQYQLRWENVKTYVKEARVLAEIKVLATTTKVRKQRSFIAICGGDFEVLRDMTGGEGYVFSVDGGETHIVRQWIHRAWHEMMSAIPESRIGEERKALLVPYSLRHHYITRMINAGAEVSQIARMCGTSIQQISKTYYHLSNEEQERVIQLGLDDFDGDLEEDYDNEEN